MFSSATVATSAIFCWTSRSTGCETCEYRYASATMIGVIASVISASFQFVQNMIAVTPTIVRMCWKKKMSP
jgi:hypothetical protein